MTGWELAKTLRQRAPDLKVVFVSAYNPEYDSQGPSPEKGEYFLQKPFSVEQVLNTVRRCLDG
jgi:CheY-like chemotaxis protein